MWFGIILIAVGIIALLQNLGILTERGWDIFWPALLVIIGLLILIKSFKRRE